MKITLVDFSAPHFNSKKYRKIKSRLENDITDDDIFIHHVPK